MTPETSAAKDHDTTSVASVPAAAWVCAEALHPPEAIATWFRLIWPPATPTVDRAFHVRSPAQKVEALAPAPALKVARGRLPVVRFAASFGFDDRGFQTLAHQPIAGDLGTKLGDQHLAGIGVGPTSLLKYLTGPQQPYQPLQN